MCRDKPCLLYKCLQHVRLCPSTSEGFLIPAPSCIYIRNFKALQSLDLSIFIKPEGHVVLRGGHPERGREGLLPVVVTQRSESQTQPWAFSDESASLDVSLVSGCGSAACLWLLGFSTVPDFLQQPLLGGRDGNWALRICSARRPHPIY